ncbi:hypothetical protein D046_5585A, partial [Vibrio parahaemolyticus V-223/04]
MTNKAKVFECRRF